MLCLIFSFTSFSEIFTAQVTHETPTVSYGVSLPINLTEPENSLRPVPYAPAVGADVQTTEPALKSSEFKHWIDDFETAGPTWLDIGGNCDYRLTKRLREKGAAMTGQGFEHLEIECDTPGSAIYMAYPISPVEVRQELLIQLALQSNRSGLQLMARIVLPFTRDPATQKAMTLYVYGGIYSSVNRWQRLRIENILRQMQTEIAKRQQEFGQQNMINPKGAYIDRLVLNAYSGPGTVDIRIDTLELNGVIPADSSVLVNSITVPTQEATSSNMREFPPTGSESTPSVPQYNTPQREQLAQSPTAPSSLTPTQLMLESGMTSNSATLQTFVPKQFDIRLNRSVMTINGTPLFVRAIRHNGEKLEFLASLGFNTIWLEAPPTRLMEAEAALLNIWFICPPPIDLRQLHGEPTQAVSEEKRNACLFNRVIAWDLGRTPTTRDIPAPINENVQGSLIVQQELKTTLDVARRQIDILKQIPTNVLPARPNLVIPDKDFTAFSSIYDILMLDRNPLNSTLGMVSYGLWFREMLNLVRAQQSIFAKIPTQFDPLLRAQWRQIATKVNGAQMDNAVSPEDPMYVPDTLPLEQLRLMTYNVIMAGSRGILYESTSRLDAQDDETLYRARSLELVNLEILILEQWLSQGEKFTTLPSNHKDVAGSLLAARHVRILLPMVLESDSQYVCGAGAERSVSFLVRGLPATYQCWLYSLNGLSPLVNRRTAGGVEVELDELPLVATIVMTQNSIIINSISQRIARYAPRLATRMKELAEIRLRAYLQFYGTEQLPGNEAMWYERAKLYLENADKALYAHEYADAFILAQRAMRPITYLEKRLWQERTARFSSPNFQPTAVSFRTLRLQEKWLRSLHGLSLGENLLPNGDFEDVRAVPQSGWNRFQKWNAFEGVTPRADIIPEAAHTGNCGLKLEVTSADRKVAPIMFDSPPVMIQSPPVYVGPPGTVYQVEFWLKIPARIINSVEGLKVTDTNSGEVLAERRLETNGWQKITYQRIVKDNNPVYLRISMTGYGVAYIDDMKIYPLKSPL
ncbi:MAG: hypothetical protein Q4C70_02555 [Planctomycetia bacterium]|nr:hypothetical protein [Planctomycetia bacterium]